MKSERDLQISHWLALLRTPKVGPATFLSLLNRFATVEAVFAAGRSDLQEAGLAEESINFITAPDWAVIEADLRWQEQPQAHIVLLHDPLYPALLSQISDPPPLLYVYGDPDCLSQPQLAMVGSRHATPMGRDTAHDFAAWLAKMGLLISSGMALGIDAASHQGALDAGGKTLAVAGTGLDRIYPAQHRELAYQIAGSGALVSEFPLGTAPLAGNFPRRNRIISGLSMGVLVVEAALQSGSLITAKQALEQGREVFAVPGSIHNPQARGCNSLIRQGAKLVETADDILEELSGIAIFAQENTQNKGVNTSVELDEEYQKVLESVGFEPTSVDVVVERSGLTADAVCSMLLVLELQGVIATTSSGHYCQTS